jgi:hypothetical protein
MKAFAQHNNIRDNFILSTLAAARLIHRQLLGAFCAGLFAIPVNCSFADDAKQIANVVQRGGFAYVYDSKGSQFLTLAAGDGVVGFTQSTVSIKRGNFIYIYNAKGSQTGVMPSSN